MNTNQKHLHILRHSLGYDDAGNDNYHGSMDGARRNWFVTPPGGEDFDLCVEMVSAGVMKTSGQPDRMGSHVFMVTDAGKEIVRATLPPRVKLTPAQDRYRRYLEADSSLSFGEWLKTDYADANYGRHS